MEDGRLALAGTEWWKPSTQSSVSKASNMTELMFRSAAWAGVLLL
jgi:hypothetical protein